MVWPDLKVEAMKCPHCLTSFHDSENVHPLVKDVDGWWGATVRRCSACDRAVIHLINAKNYYNQGDGCRANERSQVYMVRPKSMSRTPPSKHVPPDVAKDYNEACLVLTDSPQASAALSRRCLQHLLRSYAGVKASDLAREIDELLARKTLPTMLAESIDAIRNIGNFAAHPMKSQASGQIVEVEPGEAEWTLDVLESMFDFYFDQPAVLQAKRTALDAKLAGVGKPPLKK